ncbi:pyridoxal phosphate-dependent aminotransferase [Clostridiisalibacter paucivorans]|uniref:pyridoxal phosphate-dependent aminotransferase n=1 Tax=Clostridiisalibacter paucivorans TaxID=408753 RepID=UPI000478855E|nr:pyridoxal phosphate-dependent aminotransferase [Clostridiisalibacter paucivorans]
MKNKYLSKRYVHNKSTPMADVVQLSKKYDDVINLSLGDPDFITPAPIIEAGFKDAINGHTGYADSMGDLELRNGIIKYYSNNYNMEYKNDEVMVVVGACHGMYLALEAILDHGDEVIIHEPYFTPYSMQVKLARGVPKYITTKEENYFQLDIEELEKSINKKTKAIIINSPNNPTGACLSVDNMKKIAEIVKENDLILISDEVYGSFVFDGEFIPFASLEGMKERTITLGSFSKDYAMTGWRIGYVLAEDYIINCIRDINEGVCFSAPTISQRAAIKAIELSNDVKLPMVEEYKKRVEYAYRRINDISGFSAIMPKGTFYIFVNIKETGLTSLEMSKKLLEYAHVLVIPGIAFGQGGEGYIRIACTVGIDKLQQAFDRIEHIKF